MLERPVVFARLADVKNGAVARVDQTVDVMLKVLAGGQGEAHKSHSVSGIGYLPLQNRPTSVSHPTASLIGSRRHPGTDDRARESRPRTLTLQSHEL